MTVLKPALKKVDLNLILGKISGYIPISEETGEMGGFVLLIKELQTEYPKKSIPELKEQAYKLWKKMSKKEKTEYVIRWRVINKFARDRMPLHKEFRIRSIKAKTPPRVNGKKTSRKTSLKRTRSRKSRSRRSRSKSRRSRSRRSRSRRSRSKSRRSRSRRSRSTRSRSGSRRK